MNVRKLLQSAPLLLSLTPLLVTVSCGTATPHADMDESAASDPTHDTDMTDSTPQNADAAPPAYNALTPAESHVILDKGTERPGIGEYTDNKAAGTYTCRQCNIPLYTSEDKFSSHCGWPSFDDDIEGRVTRVPDADGRRVEIVCANCDGHLGHVFEGERFTEKNTRHCVNSISMRFYPEGEELPQPILSGGQP